MDATRRSRWYEFRKRFRRYRIFSLFSFFSAQNYLSTANIWLFGSTLNDETRLYSFRPIGVGDIETRTSWIPSCDEAKCSKNLRGLALPLRFQSNIETSRRIRRCYSPVKHDWRVVETDTAPIFGTRYQKCLRASDPTSICKSVRQIIFLKVDITL